MKWGLMTEPQLGGTYDELLEGARWAEAAGFVTFARSDHFYWRHDNAPDATDAFATLAGIARETSTIRLAVLVAPLTFRHPAVVAKNAATIDQMSGGRFDLGVGTGWNELEHEAFGLPFPTRADRFAQLEEGLQYLRAAFGGSPAGFDGDRYQLHADVKPKPTGPLPIIVGGSGPRKTPTLAGTHADEYNHFVTTPDALAPKLAVLRSAAEAAGRAADAVTISVMGSLVTGRTGAEYEANLAAGAEFRGIEPAEYEQKARQSGTPCGVIDDIMPRIEALERAGVEKYYVQTLTPPRADDVDRAFGALIA
ncbi:MAG: LLM class flavin-dependent oxidoreductase [Acidimicrobiia bacterium]|nr:LLM class flavin-dependent oxidoreductase [Acidimicrobiia bacterium]